MYQGAYVKKRRKSKVRMNRATVLLMAVLMLIGVVAGSTVAYLIDKTSDVKNTFEYGKVSCEITETFKDNVKSNVQVKNTGNVDAYIRAAVVVNWLDSDGNIVASVPAGYECNLQAPKNDNWVEYGGYFYYKLPVAPKDSTASSLLECTVTYPEHPEYTLSVEILATAVQSEPASAVKDAWGAGFSINADGSLNVPNN